VVKQLRGVAAKLSRDLEMQKDLLQEMFIHLVRVQVQMPEHTHSWYIKSCEFQARNCLKHGRSVDSPKRARNLVALAEHSENPDGHVFCLTDAVDPLDTLGELMARDVIDLVLRQLTDTQRKILFSLLKGMGVREVARELKVSHPAVIKQRRKIATIASELLHEDLPRQNGASTNSRRGRAAVTGGFSRS